MEPDDDPPPPRAPRPDRDPPAGRRRVIGGAVAALALLGILIALEGEGSLVIEDVPSGWGEVPMTCDTERLQDGDRAVERFWCRAIGGRSLPAGVFRSPGSQWRSDITRQAARRSLVRISPDGEVVGWATY